MKNLVLTLFLISAMFMVKAQRLAKTFMKGDFSPTDSAHAVVYMTCTHVSDTAWVVKLYGMDDTIKQTGTYKDEKLSIPHGKFVIYMKSHSMARNETAKTVDTLNRIWQTGYYKNGIKDSTWTEYFKDGYPEHISTYANGMLNGLHENYRFDTHTRSAKGNFKNDKKDGEWDAFNKHGEVIDKGIYNNGVLVSEERIHVNDVAVNYQSATPPFNFSNYIDKNLKPMMYSDLNGDLLIGFDITTEGKITNVRIIGRGISEQFNKGIIRIFENCPAWKPAYAGNPRKPVQDGSAISIKIVDGDYSYSSIGSNEQKARFYEVDH